VPVAPGRAPRGGRLRLLSALVGATGPIISPFFLGYGLRRGAYVATDALCTVGAYAARLVVFQRYDLLTRPTMSIGLFLGAVMIVGAWLGRRLLDRLSEEGFVRVIEALLVSFGVLFLLFPGR